MGKKEKLKPFSARVSPETKTRLEFLAKKYKVPQVHVMESLIWRQYDREMRKRG